MHGYWVGRICTLDYLKRNEGYRVAIKLFKDKKMDCRSQI